MSALREAVVLPAMFLTVVLAAALRPGESLVLMPPTLASLVAGMLLFALLVRSGALDPNQLVHSARPAVANLNGVSVLTVTFAASAQLITMLVPESGLPALIAWLVITSLLLQAFALAPDRLRLLRGLAVTFGAAFTLKFIILAAVSAPADGRFARALQLLFDGITFGSVTQRTPHVAEGYVAFGTIVLYLSGVALLPSSSWRTVRVGHPELAGDAPVRQLRAEHEG